MKRIAPPRKGDFKIDLGCGVHKNPGFIGLDILKFKGVDHQVDLTKRWPIANSVVDEAFTAHFIEHLTALQRIFFVNELHRVMKPEAKATVIVPHWATCRAYGDPTHQWPPVSEFWFYYLLKSWRAEHAPHTDIKNWPTGFACDFDCTWGYGMSPSILQRSEDFRQFAVNYYREAVFDIHATLTKRVQT